MVEMFTHAHFILCGSKCIIAREVSDSVGVLKMEGLINDFDSIGSSSPGNLDSSPDMIPATPTFEQTSSLAVRRLSFCNGLPSQSSAPAQIPTQVRITSNRAASPPNEQTSSSDILKQILSEVQKTNKEVDEVKASLSELDKRMAAVERRETDISSNSACSSSERQKTTVPNKFG